MSLDRAINLGNLVIWILIGAGWVFVLCDWWAAGFFTFATAVCVAFFNLGLLVAKKWLKS